MNIHNKINIRSWLSRKNWGITRLLKLNINDVIFIANHSYGPRGLRIIISKPFRKLR